VAFVLEDAPPTRPHLVAHFNRSNNIPSDQDAEAIRNVVRKFCSLSLVRERLRANVDNGPLVFSKDRTWRAMIACLLSSAQRCGPQSQVHEFSELDPYPLRLKKVLSFEPELLIRKELEAFGGLRFPARIARLAGRNVGWLENNGWEQIRWHYSALAQQRSRPPKKEDVRAEREAARFVDRKLAGFGPKQSRNLWQILGLTRFEIPIDRRVRRWINKNLSISVQMEELWQAAPYEAVLDFLQAACLKADKILPCVLDAVLFSICERD
jgi:hypothetical protein